MKALPEVRLRAMEPEDLDTLYALENDESIWEVGVTNVPYSRFVLRQYIAHSTCDIYTDRQVRLVVENVEGRVVGLVDLQDFSPAHHRAEVGIVVENESRGRGYGEAALQKLVDYARHQLHLRQLYAIVDKDNEVSQHLFEKLGFSEGSLLKGWLFDGKKYRDSVVKQLFL